MKLVGATNWFIRVPFMTEGLLQGLLGSLLAAGVVWILYALINTWGSGTTSSNVFTTIQTTTSQMIWTNVVVIVIGGLIGTIGSFIAIRRFLDV